MQPIVKVHTDLHLTMSIVPNLKPDYLSFTLTPTVMAWP